MINLSSLDTNQRFFSLFAQIKSKATVNFSFHFTASTMPTSNQVVFDWDDTLFPTTAFLNMRESGLDHVELEKLSKSVLCLLHQYLFVYGQQNVFIVTNADKRWILQSLNMAIDLCQRYSIQNSFKPIRSLILNGNIMTISAKHLYSRQHPK